MKKAYLLLEDGSLFVGEAFGAESAAIGEIVFTTGMNGFTDTLADPRAAGQIVLQTFPVVGCAGVSEEDFAKPIYAAGYVVRSVESAPSNFRAQHTIDAYLKEHGIPGIAGIDTRAITRILREKGTMRAMLKTDSAETPNAADTEKLCAYTAKNPLSLLKTEHREYSACGDVRCHITLIDYGTASEWIAPLTARGCRVTVLPHDATAEKILSLSPDGIMLSGGGGDPAANTAEIATLSAIGGKCPLFAVGLGHQMFAIAQGAKTVKLPHGHRGANYPVRDKISGRTYITAQNHGYAVNAETVKNGEVAFVNVNDGTSEGILYPALSAVTVQFTPTDAMIDAFVRDAAKKGGED